MYTAMSNILLCPYQFNFPHTSSTFPCQQATVVSYMYYEYGIRENCSKSIKHIVDCVAVTKMLSEMSCMNGQV